VCVCVLEEKTIHIARGTREVLESRERQKDRERERVSDKNIGFTLKA
jgi:hypothetical protein